MQLGQPLTGPLASLDPFHRQQLEAQQEGLHRPRLLLYTPICIVSSAAVFLCRLLMPAEGAEELGAEESAELYWRLRFGILSVGLGLVMILLVACYKYTTTCACMAPLLLLLISCYDGIEVEALGGGLAHRVLQQIVLLHLFISSLVPVTYIPTPLAMIGRCVGIVSFIINICVAIHLHDFNVAFSITLFLMTGALLGYRLREYDDFQLAYSLTIQQVQVGMQTQDEFSLEHDEYLACRTAYHRQGTISQTAFHRHATISELASDDDKPSAGYMNMPVAANRPITGGTLDWNRGMRPLRVLCMDGGGAKGLAYCELLHNLSKAIAPVKLWEAYDFVAGTSVGGALTLMTFASETPPEDLYMKLAAAFAKFTGGLRTSRLVCEGQTSTVAECMELAEDLQSKHGKTFTIEESLGHIPLLCTTTECDEYGGMTQVSLCNYNEQAYDEQWHVGEVARATTSFPTVLPAFEHPITGKVYRDGGMLCNNPSLEALKEIRSLWPTRKIDCFHSLGLSGRSESERAQAQPQGGCCRNFVQNVASVTAVIADVTLADKQTQSMLSSFYPDAKYRRLDLPMRWLGTFEAKTELYEKARQDTAHFIAHSSIYKEMVGDHKSARD